MVQPKAPGRQAHFLRQPPGCHVESDKWSAYLVVSITLGLLAVSLGLACYARATAMIALPLAVLIFAFPLTTPVRVAFWDMGTSE